MADKFQLGNGMNVEFTPEEKWAGSVFTQFEFQDGYDGQFQSATNHLIEHCLVGGFNDCQTRSTAIRYGLPTMSDDVSALKALMATAAAFKNPTLAKIDLEKEHIFEEWAGCAKQPDKFKFFGGFLNPVNPDKWDVVDMSMTPEKGLDFLNKQADITKSLTTEELQKQALFLHGAENLTLRMRGPVSIDKFKELVEQSGLKTIPSKHDGAQKISPREVPAQTEYRDVDINKVQLVFRSEKGFEKQTAEIIDKICKSAIRDENIGLYWLEKQERGGQTTLDMQITAPKMEAMKACVFQKLKQLADLNNADTQERQIALNMLDQVQNKLTPVQKNYSVPTEEPCIPQQTNGNLSAAIANKREK